MDTTTQDNQEQLRTVNAFATDTHAHLRDTITLADQKAGFLFGIVTAILAYLHTSGATQRLLQNVRGAQGGLSDALVGVALLGLVAGAVTALLVVIPRAPRPSKGIAASCAISSFPSAQEYVDLVLHSDPSALARAKLEYCWILAQISRRKYRFVNLALRCSFAGLVASIVYLALG
jgi:hypothetical protein